jgi:sulfoxide reductase heme-binding subunit YedZ
VDATHTFWYLTRASGFVAYLLLFASVTLGLIMATDLFPKRLERFRVFDLHRFIAILALAFSVFHALIVLPDAFIGFTLPQLLVPFASPYRTTWMALGVFALYLSIIVIASFYLRPLVPYAAWRLLHYTTLGVFAMALAHGRRRHRHAVAVGARYVRGNRLRSVRPAGHTPRPRRNARRAPPA